MSVPANLPENIVLLTNAADGIDSAMLLELLKSEGIDAWALDSSSGSFLRSTIGFSPAGRNIYVQQQDLEDAQNILEGFFAQSPTNNLDPHIPTEEEENAPLPSRQRSIALWVGLAVFAAAVVLISFGLK